MAAATADHQLHPWAEHETMFFQQLACSRSRTVFARLPRRHLRVCHEISSFSNILNYITCSPASIFDRQLHNHRIQRSAEKCKSHFISMVPMPPQHPPIEYSPRLSATNAFILVVAATSCRRRNGSTRPSPCPYLSQTPSLLPIINHVRSCKCCRQSCGAH
jgi:hypothetical protein